MTLANITTNLNSHSLLFCLPVNFYCLKVEKRSDVYFNYFTPCLIIEKAKRDTMAQFGNRITICLGILALVDLGKSITCTVIGDTFQDVVANTVATDGEYDMHDGFPCDVWGVSADNSVSFDWKLEEYPSIYNPETFYNILQIGKQK